MNWAKFRFLLISTFVLSTRILERLEDLLEHYFNSGDLPIKGLPSVQFVADHLNVSTNYLSGLLAPNSNPQLYNDYYTYDYNIPQTNTTSIKVTGNKVIDYVKPIAGAPLTFKQVKKILY